MALTDTSKNQYPYAPEWLRGLRPGTSMAESVGSLAEAGQSEPFSPGVQKFIGVPTDQKGAGYPYTGSVYSDSSGGLGYGPAPERAKVNPSSVLPVEPPESFVASAGQGTVPPQGVPLQGVPLQSAGDVGGLTGSDYLRSKQMAVEEPPVQGVENAVGPITRTDGKGGINTEWTPAPSTEGEPQQRNQQSSGLKTDDSMPQMAPMITPAGVPPQPGVNPMAPKENTWDKLGPRAGWGFKSRLAQYNTEQAAQAAQDQATMQTQGANDRAVLAAEGEVARTETARQGQRQQSEQYESEKARQLLNDESARGLRAAQTEKTLADAEQGKLIKVREATGDPLEPTREVVINPKNNAVYDAGGLRGPDRATAATPTPATVEKMKANLDNPAAVEEWKRKGFGPLPRK